MPVPRMPVHHRRRPQHVHGDAGDRLQITASQPKQFTRKDLERAVTREFCPECGTHLVTKVPGLPATILKVGTFDDPSVFTPQMTIFTCDKQAFHHLPEGKPSFDKMPAR